MERDTAPEHAGKMQAFGIADLGMGCELGYISIPELLENGAEFDCYFKSKTTGESLAYTPVLEAYVPAFFCATNRRSLCGRGHPARRSPGVSRRVSWNILRENQWNWTFSPSPA